MGLVERLESKNNTIHLRLDTPPLYIIIRFNYISFVCPPPPFRNQANLFGRRSLKPELDAVLHSRSH